jgi:hypothetical protein
MVTEGTVPNAVRYFEDCRKMLDVGFYSSVCWRSYPLVRILQTYPILAILQDL